MVNLLLVDDNIGMLELLKAHLSTEGYALFSAQNGKEALKMLEHQVFHLMIADVMMPEMDGFELIQLMRSYHYEIPILLLTAKSNLFDKRIGFESGADDYMVKPVNMDELKLRIKALLRRAKINSERMITIGKTTLSQDTLQVITSDRVIELPPKEFFLLYHLLSYPNRIFTRQDLMDAVWGLDAQADERTVDVHIKRLREKFSDSPDFEIVTVRGLGYKARESNI